MSLLSNAGLLAAAGLDLMLVQPLQLLRPGLTARAWSEEEKRHVTAQAEPTLLWTGRGSLQVNLKAESPVPGDLGGTQEALPTHRAYLPNTATVRTALQAPGLYLLDQDVSSTTFGSAFKLLKEPSAMAGRGPIRLELRRVTSVQAEPEPLDPTDPEAE